MFFELHGQSIPVETGFQKPGLKGDSERQVRQCSSEQGFHSLGEKGAEKLPVEREVEG